MAIFVLAGVFQIVFGVLRIGQYVQFMPYPVVSGFISGIGVIIIILQIFPFLGHESPKRITEVLVGIPDVLPLTNTSSVILASATIAMIYIFPRITKAVPSPLVALIVLTVVSTVVNLDVGIIGDVPTGFPKILLSELAGVEFSELTGSGVNPRRLGRN